MSRLENGLTIFEMIHMFDFLHTHMYLHMHSGQKFQNAWYTLFYKMGNTNICGNQMQLFTSAFPYTWHLPKQEGIEGKLDVHATLEWKQQRAKREHKEQEACSDRTSKVWLLWRFFYVTTRLFK